MSLLQDGMNDLGDTIVLSLPNASQTIREWESIKLNSKFTEACDELEFTVSNDSIGSIALIMMPGTLIQLSINDRIHFTGYLDKLKKSYNREQGTMLTWYCRDILGPVVGSHADPQLHFKADQTLLDFLATLLIPFGIKKIYNDGSVNVNIMTGRVQKPTAANQSVSVQLPVESIQSDGTVDVEFTTQSIMVQTSGRTTPPSGIKLTQLKVHPKEGVYQLIDRQLKRFGLRMWAAADGSGVIVGAPDYTSTPTHTLVHSVTSSQSDIESAELITDWEKQPSCILATGIGGTEPNGSRAAMAVIMVNELVACDQNGNITQDVKTIIAKYPGATVLPVRQKILPGRKYFPDNLITQPYILKDDQSRTIDQLTSLVRRTMSQFQNEALHLKYQLTGLSQNGVPFCINSNVIVNDEIMDISTPLWILEREYSRNRIAGSTTVITMCLPYSLDLTGDEE